MYDFQHHKNTALDWKWIKHSIHIHKDLLKALKRKLFEQSIEYNKRAIDPMKDPEIWKRTVFAIKLNIA